MNKIYTGLIALVALTSTVSAQRILPAKPSGEVRMFAELLKKNGSRSILPFNGASIYSHTKGCYSMTYVDANKNGKIDGGDYITYQINSNFQNINRGVYHDIGLNGPDRGDLINRFRQRNNDCFDNFIREKADVQHAKKIELDVKRVLFPGFYVA